MYDFGAVLAGLRKERGYTQLQLAKKLGINKTQISRYETNKRMPTLETLISISILFGVDLNYLSGTEKTKTFLIKGLSQSQINLLNTMILEFQEHKHSTKYGMSARQLDIVNSLFIEFSNKK